MKKTTVIILFIIIPQLSICQNVNSVDLKNNLSSALTNIYKDVMKRKGRVNIDSIKVNDKKKIIEIYTNLTLSYIPMRLETVETINDSIKYHLPSSLEKYKLLTVTDGKVINDLVPNFYRKSNLDKDRIISHKVKTPLKTNLSAPVMEFNKGLSNRHLAIWQSHGWYYEQKLSRWEWQRARIFQTVEDLYTQSYVLPFLVHMLENAGANVLLPRERDYNKNEIIVDNNSSSNKSSYKEFIGKEKWQNADSAGFAHIKESYIDGENPFKLGTSRQVKTIKRGTESTATWTPNFTEKGKYGVYISYQTLKNSTEDAKYSVYHAGGKTDFLINQKMGGGTWIFLGYFTFDKGDNHKITITNLSQKSGRIITADAVKIGGGMGNVARMPHPEGFENENTKSSEIKNPKKNISNNIKYTPQVSGYPRYTEGSRYWLQWAGAPDSIYNRGNSKNDYTDDYQSRGFWVNYLAGGSSVLPKENGLSIPLDLAFAFHTDAGTTLNDTIIGTLGIYMTHFNDEKFKNGHSRWASRDLTELIMHEIVSDIRRDFEPEWTLRPMWNRSYSEARVPNVPTMLLELLSHQNFADMRYGLDPSFRFIVSRSIYKGMLKFIASQYNQAYVVQPLPVKDFSTVFEGEQAVKLTWNETIDVAEPSAKPDKYIVYTRIGNGDFDNGVLSDKNHFIATIKKDSIYSFKITAVNEGGESFPSEILSVCRNSKERGEALIVNGFTRVSAPFSFSTKDSIAGFVGRIDNGVPYIEDHSFIGQMHEFRRVVPWMDDDASGFGDSDANFETTSIAGNTFDYPYLHGKALMENGFSFVSSSSLAVENGYTKLSNYVLVDWILGKQREWTIARGAMPTKYKTFSTKLQNQITDYCNSGGNIIVSGAFVGTDLWDNPNASIEDKNWAQNTLKFKWRNNYGGVTGKIKAVESPYKSINGNYEYYNELNSISYVVENPDAIEPVGEEAHTIYRYSENNLSAGVIYKGNKYNSCILGFPIESLKSQDQRNELMGNIIDVMF